MVGREQHRQRLQPDQSRVEVVDWSLIDPCGAPEDDLELAESQALECAADPTTVAAAELDVRPVLLLLVSLLLLSSLLLLVLANTGITTTLDNAKMAAAVTSATVDIAFFVFIVVVVK